MTVLVIKNIKMMMLMMTVTMKWKMMEREFVKNNNKSRFFSLYFHHNTINRQNTTPALRPVITAVLFR